MMRTFTALFDTRADAEAVQADLERLGIMNADASRIYDQTSPGFSRDSYSSDENRGFWAALRDMFLPDEDRHFYEEGIRRGGYLLTVRVDDQHADRVHDILENSKAVNVEEREREYRASGWMPPAMGAATATGVATDRTTTATGDRATGQSVSEERIPMIEEQLQVGKREVVRGGVRVRSYVVEQPVHEEVNLREEHVSVERRPVDQPVSSADLADGDNNLLRERNIEVTETAEEAVVAKEARVREEVVVRKDVEERTKQIDDTVRRTAVEIDDQRGTEPSGRQDRS